MCGIVGYIGTKEAAPILVRGLKRLEYRGYDSAGLAVLGKEGISWQKKQGKVKNLEDALSAHPLHGALGIAHTRWATHGVPSDQNAHPHRSQHGEVYVVHNGIIENYAELKKELTQRGHTWESETDTEVLAHLIGDIVAHGTNSLQESVRLALTQVRGAYAIVVMSAKDPSTLVAARKGSPLAIGMGTGEFFIASDASAILEYTNQVLYLNDEEVAQVSLDGSGVTIVSLSKEVKNPYIETLSMSLEDAEKGSFPHFMLKEIFEQPKSLTDCMRGRLNMQDETIMLGGVRNHEKQLREVKKITLVACGTASYAALAGARYFEEFCRVPAQVVIASEYRYQNPIIGENEIVISVSQSGETADTLAAIRLAKERGALALGITNAVGSSIARETDAGVYLHAGPEISVASTKAFTAQVLALLMLALRISELKGTFNGERKKELFAQMRNIPNLIEEQLKKAGDIEVLAKKFIDTTDVFYIGRGYGVAAAFEGSIKLKELSYVHAEAYPAGEMKHGPISLLDETFPVVAIATRSAHVEKVVSNIEEARARKAKVIMLATEGDASRSDIADHTIPVPDVDEALTPIITAVPLQLFAYYSATLRGRDVDHPRNLAKSVTVE
ncbi:MAG TPA: glutamine--fructose-6-phosphate transaminase (isomerizing) [Candidatus Paceibacterota bacterium]|nr:glutamine--fructose-6-phosphate transaminase (isomerizing) [Candidatus Paceibacterota bacterium]